MKQVMVILAALLLLVSCASVSEKNQKLAEQSMQKGDYASAFDQASHSLHAEIGNHKAIALFPAIAEHAFAQKLTEIDHYRAAANWDRAAYGYDRIIDMNRTVQSIQDAMRTYAQKVQVTRARRAAMNQLLAIRQHDVAALRDEAYERAAAGHYGNGKRYQAARDYRQATQEFNQALSFVSGYRDAIKLAAETKHLADLADARIEYAKGGQAIRTHDHRAAATAFARADAFIRGFKDAHQLSMKYMAIADQEDALANYLQGERLAEAHHYRDAAAAFTAALGFVPDFRDATQLATHYTDLANREDARRSYREGERLMDRQEFDQAAIAFDKADRFVPGFRHARDMAARARSYIAPEFFELRGLVQKSVDNGIPLSWLRDVHQGYAEDVKISTIRIIRQGRFNTTHEYWPYRLQVKGVCDLEVAKGNEQKLAFDTVVDYRVFRDDFGEWRATFR
ncbi:hypothetical protein F3F93_06325 [Mariprofundus sp. KV]|nr:hypothetical protein [Mariprofundus sp. KV]